jgi:glycogen operon protein
MMHPRVLQLLMDSLRYWTNEMHVDGFRFDLASALARELFEVNSLSAFFDVIHQDPIISQVKLIAEPWDVGAGGYQVGNFPVLWTEWNGKYRDTMRRFIKGDQGELGQFATRFTGSSDLYERTGRKPFASINFITCHDGFPLHDLVSYNEKHNEANGENNRDGESHNCSWNCGAEGQSDDSKILDFRFKQKRNFMTALLMSIGVPMLSGGDELSRTQGGNNNAYCQDNEISWYNWELNEREQAFFNFVKKVMAIRKSQLTIQRKDFRTEGAEIIWYSPAGKEMTEAQWTKADQNCVGVMLKSNGLSEEVHSAGQETKAQTLLFLVNPSASKISFQLPSYNNNETWNVLLDTRFENGGDAQDVSGKIELAEYSIQLLCSKYEAPPSEHQ